MSLNIPPLVLSASVRIWALIPISLACFFMALIRRNLVALFQIPPTVSLPKLTRAANLQRAKLFLMNNSYIPAEQCHIRRHYFSRSKGPLDVPKTQRKAMSTIMSPESLSNQVMALLLTLLPSILLGTWARYSFSGMVVCRLPFSLTPRFRGMLQSGLEMVGANLDITYVSAFSWYLLNIFGSAGLVGLIARASADENLFMPNVATEVAEKIAPEREFQRMRDDLLKMEHEYLLEDVEERLLQSDIQEFAVF